MDALILTCGTGGGHNSAAKAVKEEMERRGHHVHLMNPYMLRSMALTRAIDGLYIFIAKRMPRFFGVIITLERLTGDFRGIRRCMELITGQRGVSTII